MPKLRDVCRYVRSKNAGPFWITVDLFFDGPEMFQRYRESETLSPATFASLYDTDPALVKRMPVDDLNMIKISYARPQPQAWRGERDMHGGQQYVRLLDLEMA